VNLKLLSNLFKYFGRFSLVGVFTTVSYFILTNLFIYFELASPIVSSTISYGFLTVVSYLGHANFTFNVLQKNTEQVKKFFLISISGILTSNLIILLSTNYLLLSPFLAVLIVTGSIPLINFFLLKYWVFGTE